MGRKPKYDNEDDRRNANRESKTRYMLNKSWICEACGGHDYKLAGKHCHLRSRKHIFNTIIKALEDDDDIELITDE